MILEIAVRVARTPMSDLEDWGNFEIHPQELETEQGQKAVIAKLQKLVGEARHYGETGHYPKMDGTDIER